MLAAALCACMAQNISASLDTASFMDGGQANLGLARGEDGSTAETADGRTKTIGAISDPPGSAFNMTGVDTVRVPPPPDVVESHPSSGMSTPAILRNSSGPEGTSLSSCHVGGEHITRNEHTQCTRLQATGLGSIYLGTVNKTPLNCYPYNKSYARL